MRVLVTGVNGFVGGHTVRDLQAAGHVVCGFDVSSPSEPPAGLEIHAGDIRDESVVNEAVAKLHPEACVHLSALSFVPESWQNPAAIFSVNLLGTLNLLEAFRRHAPEARILVVSSAEVYGRRPRSGPVREDDWLDPDNPYAISKAAADRMSLLFALQHGMRVMTARPYNHIGPGQGSRFVVSAFASQLAAIALGKVPAVLKVGNLDSQRDFTDVRDIARAYRLILERGQPARAYNLCSQRSVSIRSVLDQMCDFLNIHPAVEVDPRLYRQAGERPALDMQRAEKDLLWNPEIPLGATLRDILTEATRRLAAGSNA